MNKKSTKSKPQKKVSWAKKLTIAVWVLFFIGVLAIVGIFYGASKGFLGEMPDITDLENPDIFISSEIISSDGVILDRFEMEKRIPIEYDSLPQHLIEALLAREDVRYWEHSGIDLRATVRAVKSLGKDGGGSTITQQLAKQLFTVTPSSNIKERIEQKVKEWIVALQLERQYTKEEIISMYFNKFDFIYGANGVELAARTYFNTTAAELNLEQAATIVAMFKNPVQYNPKKNPEKAEHERNVVINQMEKYNFLTPEEAKEAKAKPLGVNFNPSGTQEDESYSAYYKNALRKGIQSILKEYEEESGKKYNLYKDGLRIYVTLDSRMQKMAENAVAKHLTHMQKLFFNEHKNRELAPFYKISKAKAQNIFEQAMRRTDLYKKMKENKVSEDSILLEFNRKRDSVQIFTWDGVKYQKDMSLMDSIKYHKHILQAGLMSMNPNDGTIRAWVGGINWDYFKYDHVYQARRQVGSTFKPFVYVTAINQMNYTPCHTVSNEAFTSGNWRPRNANGKYGGRRDLRSALAWSTNVVAARLITQTGVMPVKQLIGEMGIESPVPNDPTIALGSADLTVYEMVGAMSTFANQGIYIKPELILRIEDRTGRVIKDYKPETREVINEDVAYTMIDLMKSVTDTGTGRGVRSRGITAEVASKTGTTNDNSDGWFIGLTPNLVTGVWVGAEDRFAHFASTGLGGGSGSALPIWVYYMQEVYKKGKDLGIAQSDKFEKPEGIDDRWDCSSLTGFHNYGGKIDRVGGESSLSSVNDVFTEGDDGIDFNLNDN